MGAWCCSSSSTCSPLARVQLFTSRRGVVCCGGAARAAAAQASVTPTRRNLEARTRRKATGERICHGQVSLTVPSSDRDPEPATLLTPDAPFAVGEVRSGPVVLPPLATWRRALGLLWLGQVVSHLGDSLFLVSIAYLAREVTGSWAKGGLMVAVNFVPALALGLFAGAFVDRHDRRHVMIAADLVRALAVGAIPALYLTGHLGAIALAAAVF